MKSQPEAWSIHELDDELAPSELQVVLSGAVGPRQVLRAIGPMTEAGARLLMALVEQSVRKGCTYLRVDLTAVTAMDVVGMRILREFQAMMRSNGVLVGLIDPQRRAGQPGQPALRSAGLTGAGVLV